MDNLIKDRALYIVCTSFDRSPEMWKAKIGFCLDAYEVIFIFLFAPEEYELLYVCIPGHCPKLCH